uniref:Tetratricopeptide repeat protein n=1 Tax=Streptomyces sp. NBC_00093 TaxID=2975649 RepID=A0AAU1ZVT6_9ACTN
MVLSGPGGVGKSQLAASLARELRDQERSDETGLDVLVWVRATGTDQVITAYAEAAGRLLLPGVSPDDEDGAARLFLRWLAATRQQWLVVLDDVADPADIQEWWPDSGAGRGWVLATSRREDAQLSGQGRTLIRLGLYTDSEARAYLQRRLTDAGHARLHDPAQAREMAAELGHLPLALGHTAAYLINTRRSMANYLALLRDTSSRLGDLLPPSGDTEGYGRPVSASLLLSLDAVQESDTSGLARPLLHLASLMAPLGHPATTWTTPAVLSHLRTARPPQRRWLRRHHPAVTETEVHSTLEILRTYALITQDTDTAPVQMHALTARAVREIIPTHSLPTTARAVADAISSLWPVLEHENRELSAMLRANTVHLDHHTNLALWRPTSHPCIHKVSSSLRKAGLYQQATGYDEGIVRRSIDIHGANHPSTLTGHHHLAASYLAAGRAQDALDLAEKVLSDSERILGLDHPNTLTARNNLANSHQAAGHPQKALHLAEKVVADSERIHGTNHPDTLTARNNLANSHQAAGHPQKALNLAEKVLADSERIHGHDHPNTLTARHNVAGFYLAAGHPQKALNLAEKVLADSERIHGHDHPNTLTARHNVAGFYLAAGHPQKALNLAEKVLADSERVHGTNHPYTLSARGNLANSYRAAGHPQKALNLAEKVLADSERIHGTDHPDTLSIRGNLANSYWAAGHEQDAFSLSQKCVEDSERIHGTNHPNTLIARGNLANLYLATGHPQKALNLAEKVLADSERIHGTNHPYTLSARYSLAMSYLATGHPQKALHLAEKVVADSERIRGTDHPKTLTARNGLAHAREAVEALQRTDTATPANASAPQPPSGPPEQPV